MILGDSKGADHVIFGYFTYLRVDLALLLQSSFFSFMAMLNCLKKDSPNFPGMKCNDSCKSKYLHPSSLFSHLLPDLFSSFLVLCLSIAEISAAVVTTLFVLIVVHLLPLILHLTQIGHWRSHLH